MFLDLPPTEDILTATYLGDQGSHKVSFKYYRIYFNLYLT